ncbi:MAG: right-handed parallel beta-helix repeat-containing protein [Planctomycetes bacterium]|nr:right-handed parallel beta-helix repeat-containing protein [Planctomycetota bacterium]
MRTILLVATLLACGLNAAELFVATTGDDAAMGSKDAPLASLTRALALAKAGDTITLRAGTYAGGQTISLPDITVQSFAGETATVKVPNDVERQGNCLWATANDVAFKRLDIEGGFYYVLKFELGVVGGLVEDCRVHGSGRDCIKIAGADRITIRRCEIYDSGLRDSSNAEGIDNVNGDYMLVQDCYIHDIATCGVYPKGGSIGSIIERCFITRCNAAGISMAQSSGLQFYDKQANPEFYSCRDCIARNNIIVDIKGSGIDLEAALRPKVYNNTLVNVAQTMRAGIRICGNNKGGDAGLVKVKDADIRNNIIVISAESRRPAIAMHKDSHEGTLTLSNNHYHKVGGKPLFWWEPDNAYNLDLDGWQKASGEKEATQGDPGLDETWHLKKDSPCIGKAANLAPTEKEAKDKPATGKRNPEAKAEARPTAPEFAEDYDGNQRPGQKDRKPWDQGADQTGADPLPTPPRKETPGTGARADQRSAKR